MSFKEIIVVEAVSGARAPSKVEKGFQRGRGATEESYEAKVDCFPKISQRCLPCHMFYNPFPEGWSLWSLLLGAVWNCVTASPVSRHPATLLSESPSKAIQRDRAERDQCRCLADSLAGSWPRSASAVPQGTEDAPDDSTSSCPVTPPSGLPRGGPVHCGAKKT